MISGGNKNSNSTCTLVIHQFQPSINSVNVTSSITTNQTKQVIAIVVPRTWARREGLARAG